MPLVHVIPCASLSLASSVAGGSARYLHGRRLVGGYRHGARTSSWSWRRRDAVPAHAGMGAGSRGRRRERSRRSALAPSEANATGAVRVRVCDHTGLGGASAARAPASRGLWRVGRRSAGRCVEPELSAASTGGDVEHGGWRGKGFERRRGVSFVGTEGGMRLPAHRAWGGGCGPGAQASGCSASGKIDAVGF